MQLRHTQWHIHVHTMKYTWHDTIIGYVNYTEGWFGAHLSNSSEVWNFNHKVVSTSYIKVLYKYYWWQV